MDFEVKLSGVNLPKLTKVDGPNGIFYVAFGAASGSEEVYKFFYGDGDIQLFFWASYEVNTDPSTGSRLQSVLVSRIAHIISDVGNDHIQVKIGKAKENIVYYFSERSFYLPDVYLRPDSRNVQVTFAVGG